MNGKFKNNGNNVKTMENLRKRISVKLVNNEKHLKHVSKPTYVSRRIFDKHSPAIH